MEELGIRPGLIVGTSMGAIIGSLYAAGYTGAEIEGLVNALPLHEIFCGYSPEMPVPLDDLPVFVTLRQKKGGPLVPHLPLAKAPLAERIIREALSNGSPESSLEFSSLTIPLYVIATDLSVPEPVVLSQGDVVRAVMASSAIPLVLEPVEILGVDLIDGGMRENIPVPTARRFGAERVIVSDATAKLDLEGEDLGSITTMLGALTSVLFRQEEPDLNPEDVLIRPDLDKYPKLGFSRKEKRALVRLGYRAGMEALQPVRGDPDGNGSSPFALPAEAGVTTDAREGGPPESASALLHLPTALENIVLPPDVLPQGSRFLGASGGYDHELGAFARVGVVDRRILQSLGVLGGVAFVGHQENRIEVSLRSGSDLFARVVPLVSVSGSHRRFPQFDVEGNNLKTRDITSFTGFLGPERRLRTGWILRGGLRLETWNDPEEPGLRSAVGGEFTVLRRRPAAAQIRVEGTVTGSFSRASAEARWEARLGTVLITPGLRLGWGRNLPYLHTFPLGGLRGFPGFHIGEGRGQREALITLGAEHALVGPLRLGLEVAAGIGGERETSVPSDHVHLGARVVLGLDTVLGRIDLGYGRTDRGRGALYFRIGKLN